MAAWIGHQNGWESLTLNLLLLGGCGLIVAIKWLPERGLFTWAAWSIHLTCLSLLGFAIGLNARQPEWLMPWLATQWVDPIRLPNPEIAQLGLLFWLVALLGLLVMLILKQQRRSFNGIISALTLLVLVTTTDQILAILAASSGLLILLLSALQNAWHLAYVDELTALPGRRALEEKLQRSLGIYALAMVDVDHFKKFNDTYGHDVGDDVLRMIAAKIGAVGGGGHAYRYGGEEFTIVFNNHSADEIRDHLQAVIDDVANTPFIVNRRKGQKPKPVKVTISIGLTDSIHKTHTAETIKTADQALYTAKKKGRNRLQLKN